MPGQFRHFPPTDTVSKQVGCRPPAHLPFRPFYSSFSLFTRKKCVLVQVMAPHYNVNIIRSLAASREYNTSSGAILQFVIRALHKRH